MRDVAQRAKVSQATVSFVVNNTKPLPAETRARVERAMEELGYRRNELARGLATRKSRIIALLLPVVERSISGTAFRFLASAAGRAHERGYTLVVWPIGEHADDLVELTASALVEGVVVMEVYLDDQRIPLLQEEGLPFALIGRTRSAGGQPFVDVDFDQTMRDAVAMSAELGHRSVVLLVGPDAESGFGPRERSIEAFLRRGSEMCISAHTLVASDDPAARARVADELLQRFPDATAVLVEHETLAPALVSGLRRLGRRVPEDMSVALTVSSEGMATLVHPPLTLWEAPSAELGRQGVDALIDQLENQAAQVIHDLVPCRFIDHGTLAAAPPPR